MDTPHMLPAAPVHFLANFDAFWHGFCPPEPESQQMLTWLAMLTPPAARLLELSLGPVPLVAEPVAKLPPALPRKPGTRAPQAAMPYWKIEAAYDYDLAGATYCDVARALELSIDLYEDRSRSAERYVSEGRQYLKRLGAWPWAAGEAVLPRDWRTQKVYAVSLAQWHWEGWQRGFLQQERATDWAGGDHARWRRSSPAEIWAVYVDALLRARERFREREASKPKPDLAEPPRVPNDDSTYVLLTEDRDYFFPSLRAAEDWIARNIAGNDDGRRTIQTIEGYNLRRAWERDAA